MQKGTAVEGALLDEEVLESSDDILKLSQFGNLKGAQQFYSPPELAKLIANVLGRGNDRVEIPTFDPTAGDGSLLKYVDPARAFGVEIDKDQIKAAEGGYNAIAADLKAVMPLIYRVCPSFPAVVANPPFGLEDWSDETVEDGKRLGSTLLTWIYAQRMVQEDGQVIFITGKNRFYREIAIRPDASGVYYVVECDDLFEGTSEPCVIAFAVHPSLRKDTKLEDGSYGTSTGYITKEVPRGMLDLLPQDIKSERKKQIGQYNSVCDYVYAGGGAYLEAFTAIQTEHNRRRRVEKGQKVAQLYDIQPNGNKISVKPSPYAQLALAKLNLLNRLKGLNGKPLNWFAQYERDWALIEEALSNGVVTIDPTLEGRVLAIIEEQRKNVLPLYPIKDTQRLGFLTRQNQIKCKKTDEERGFIQGQTYAISAESLTQERTNKEWVPILRGDNAGEFREVEYLFISKVLDICIRNDRGRAHHFYDSASHQEDIRFVIDHFELPDPGDVGSKFPEEVENNQDLLWALQREMKVHADKYDAENPKAKKQTFKKLRHFQVQDLSRLLTKLSGLLAWHQGLGKTIGGLAWFEMQKRRNRIKDRWLIICPQDLIDQWQEELQRFAGRKPEILKTHGDAVRIKQHFKNGGTGWYITYYEALSTNGVRGKTKLKEEVTVEVKVENVRVPGTGKRGDAVMAYRDEAGGFWQALSRGEYNDYAYADRQAKGVQWIPYNKEKFPFQPPKDGGPAFTGWGYINPIYTEKQKVLTSRHLCPSCKTERGKGWNGMACTAEIEDGVRCNYVHWEHRCKPMGSLLSVAFKNGAITVDEGTMISSDISKRSEVIRGLNAKCKLLMTGTPIKEYIPQAFWPLWWCLGNQSKRFPFGYKEKSSFEEKHAVIRYTLSGGKKAQRKVLPEVTGLAELWAMLPASIIRRRKEETGEPLVKHTLHPVTVPLGEAQVEQMAQWVARFPDWFIENRPDSDVTKASKQVVEQMAPMIGLGQKLEWAATCPLGDPDWEWTGVENLSNWTPANLRTLLITLSLTKKGRKVIVGSSLIKEAQWLADRLNEKGVNVVSFIDESGATIAPKKRAKMVKTFQQGGADVIVTTMKSLRFGHNVDAATAMVINGLPWEYEVWDQFISRHHRFTSIKPIDTYIVIPGKKPEKGTLDTATVTRRKWELVNQKGDAAALALDGRLIEAEIEEISEAEVTRELMEKGFTITGSEVPEEEVEDFWTSIPDISEFEVDERWLEGDLEDEAEKGPYPWMVQTSLFGDHTQPQLALPVTASAWMTPELPEVPVYWVAEQPPEYVNVVAIRAQHDDEINAFLSAKADELPDLELDWENPTQEMIEAEAEPEHGHHEELFEIPPGRFDITEEEIATLPILPPEVLEPAASTESDPTKLVTALKELAELHTLGVLTDDEFSEGKAGLLAQMKRAA